MNLLRNLFDQYRQQENRLTHALVQTLGRDAGLARAFVRLATGAAPPERAALSFSCQLLPGEGLAPVDEDEAERRGLPDAWIFDGEWAVVLENKVTAALTSDQLRRHLAMARRLGFVQPHLLVITADESRPQALDGLPHASWLNWPQVFLFFSRRADGSLTREFVEYIRVVEARMIADGYQGPPLTTFTGVPFGPEHPYSEAEAKVILRALMKDLRSRLAASAALPVNPAIRRPALAKPWDVIGFRFASEAGQFTEHPHLTVGILRESADLQLTVPHNAGADYWRRLQRADRLGDVLADVARRARPVRRRPAGGLREPQITLHLYQRHFYTRRASVTDGQVWFDLDTLLDRERKPAATVRAIPAWLDAFGTVLAQSRRANFELALRARFVYHEGSVCRRPEFTEVLARTAEAFAPLLAMLRGVAMRGSRTRGG